MALVDIFRTIGDFLPWREESQKLDYNAQVDELAADTARDSADDVPAKVDSGVKGPDGQTSGLFSNAPKAGE